MKASINEDECTGCEACSDSCPEVFEMIGDIAAVKVDPIPEDQEDCVREAAEDCPSEAIIIEE